MTKSLNADCTHDRLIRFVESGTLPGANTLSIYDDTQNLLLVDRELFAGLSEVEQRRTLRTHRGAITVVHA